MKIDAPLVVGELAGVPRAARDLAADGFDGIYTFEGPHDPFLPLTLAAEHTDELELMTAVAIAFARNPMTVAQLGWDLEAVAPGRVIIGLGTQIRAHVERRFSMPWSAPADRMREFVLAVRAIWATWQTGTPLAHHGTYYTHTLMTPFFSPAPIPAPPRLFIAGIGPGMTRVAGAVADGFFVHPFSTPDFIGQHTVPLLREGDRGRDPDFPIAWPVMIATGPDPEARAAAELATRAQIAFYGSTPAYRPVLDHHGRGELQPLLRERTRTGDWEQMVELVDDELFDLVAVRGTPQECGEEVARRTAGLVTRIGINAPYSADRETWRVLLKEIRRAVDATATTSRRSPAP